MEFSLRRLLKKFPYFIEKKEGSNFYKSESVFNAWFRDISQDLMETYLSQHLKKPLLIWKCQDHDYEATIHFLAVVDNLKSARVLKNGDCIYMEEYKYGSFSKVFYWEHSEVSDSPITDAEFVLEIETWDEYKFRKGFPENDVKQGDIFDHDESLDKIGALNDIRRKEYVVVDPSEYALTEPAYNDRLTEDDYHYMQRLLLYNELYHIVPLPILKLWSLYNVDVRMENRQSRLVKMFDEERHLGADGEYNPYWLPNRWEHKDKQCAYDETDQMFLFVNLDNYRPVAGQNVLFTLRMLNMYGKKIERDYVYLCYVNGEVLLDDDGLPIVIIDSRLKLNSRRFAELPDVVFRFKAFNDVESALREVEYSNGKLEVHEEDIVSKEIRLVVVGCDDADFFVSMDGDDSNEGTKAEPFRTLEHALRQVEGDQNIINILSGEYEFETPWDITGKVVLLSCAEKPPIVHCSDLDVFRVQKNSQIDLINLVFKRNCCRITAVDGSVLNHSSRPFTVNINPERACKIPVTIIHEIPSSVNVLEPLSAPVGLRNDKDGSTVGEMVDIYLDGELLDSVNGVWSKTFDFGGVYDLLLRHEESLDYCEAVEEMRFTIYHLTELLVGDDGELSLRTSHEDLELELSEENSDLTATFDDTDILSITISDNGDIVLEETYED